MRRVSEPLLIAALCVGALAYLRLALAYLRYRGDHPYGEAEMEAARRDSVRRSRAVMAGRGAEQLAPHLPAFSERFEAADARFLGAPVDYVVFDGLAGGALREVVLVEVKTGGSRLSANERQVRAAIEAGRVGYRVLRL